MCLISAIARLVEKELAEEPGVGGFSQMHARLISNTARSKSITRNGFDLVSLAHSMGIILLPRKDLNVRTSGRDESIASSLLPSRAFVPICRTGGTWPLQTLLNWLRFLTGVRGV